MSDEWLWVVVKIQNGDAVCATIANLRDTPAPTSSTDMSKEELENLRRIQQYATASILITRRRDSSFVHPEQLAEVNEQVSKFVENTFSDTKALNTESASVGLDITQSCLSNPDKIIDKEKKESILVSATNIISSALSVSHFEERKDDNKTSSDPVTDDTKQTKVLSTEQRSALESFVTKLDNVVGNIGKMAASTVEVDSPPKVLKSESILISAEKRKPTSLSTRPFNTGLNPTFQYDFTIPDTLSASLASLSSVETTVVKWEKNPYATLSTDPLAAGGIISFSLFSNNTELKIRRLSEPIEFWMNGKEDHAQGARKMLEDQTCVSGHQECRNLLFAHYEKSKASLMASDVICNTPTRAIFIVYTTIMTLMICYCTKQIYRLLKANILNSDLCQHYFLIVPSVVFLLVRVKNMR